MKTIISKFCRDEVGTTAIEYGMIAALIALAIVSGVTGVGNKLSTVFANISTSI